MFLSPVIGMIHNTKADTYHPVLFCESPLPGNSGPVRHKSKMHHTGGYDSREVALRDIHEKLLPEVKPHAIGEIKLSLEADFEWDGEDIPTIVEFFGLHDDQPVESFQR